MADEPLQTLIPHVRPARKHRRATWQPGQFTGDLAPGQRGQMSSLEALDLNDSYAPDIGDPNPPTRLASGAEEDYADEGEGGQPNPFMFASDTGQGGVVPVGCEDGRCGIPMGMQPSPYQMAPSLPPGVTVAPGEKYVEGSLKEVPTRASAPVATVGPAPSQPAAARPQATQNSDSFDRAKKMADQIYGPAIQAYSSMQGAPSAQDAVAFRLLGDAHMRVGDQVFGQIQNEELSRQADRLEGQANELLALKDPAKRQAKDVEVVTAIRAGEGSVRQRAQDVVFYKLRPILGDAEMQSGEVEAMIREEEKVVHARDIASSLDAARSLGRTIDSQGQPATYQQQVMQWRFANEMRFRLRERYGAETDPNKLRLAITGELGKTYEYSIRKDLEARGVSGDELEFRSAFDTRTAIDAAVSSVMAMQRGQSPELALPMPPKREGQADAPVQQAQPKTSSWWDAITSSPW